MLQEQLWHESIEDALRAIVEATGGPKAVGSDMWPTKRIADAARHLNHCLDQERPEKLSLNELMYLAKRGREQGVHTLLHFLSVELNYQPPQPIEPDDERVRLQREFQASVRNQQQMLERLERLAGLPAMKAAS